MTTTDPIADYLTRLRNAIMAHKKVVEVPASNLKRDITRILYDKGYILSWKTEEDGKQGIIKIALKYNAQTRQSAISELTRVSLVTLAICTQITYKAFVNCLRVS